MEVVQTGLSLHMSKCHIVGNHMSRLNYYVVVELCAFLLTDHGRRDSYSDYSADTWDRQDYSADSRVVQDSHSDYTVDRGLTLQCRPKGSASLI